MPFVSEMRFRIRKIGLAELEAVGSTIPHKKRIDVLQLNPHLFDR